MKTIVVVPVRNEEVALPVTLAQLQKYDVIVVDGHSRDGSADAARKMGHEPILSAGPTYGDAVMTGMRAALTKGAEQVIVLDVESHNIHEIEPHLCCDYDILAGRRQREHKGLIRKVISLVGRFYRWLYIPVEIHDPSNGFRAYKRHIVEGILDIYQDRRIPSYAFNFAIASHALLIDRKVRVKEFPMTYVGGRSGLTAKELFTAAVWIRRNCL